jgi:hypothetical protein
MARATSPGMPACVRAHDAKCFSVATCRLIVAGSFRFARIVDLNRSTAAASRAPSSVPAPSAETSALACVRRLATERRPCVVQASR